MRLSQYRLSLRNSKCCCYASMRRRLYNKAVLHERFDMEESKKESESGSTRCEKSITSFLTYKLCIEAEGKWSSAALCFSFSSTSLLLEAEYQSNTHTVGCNQDRSSVEQGSHHMFLRLGRQLLH